MKKIIAILIGFGLIIIAVFGVFLLKYLKPPISINPSVTTPLTNASPTPQQQENEMQIESYLTNYQGKPAIAVSVSPINDSFTLSVFNLGAKIIFPSEDQSLSITENKKLIDEAWKFPLIDLVELDDHQGVTVKVAGVRFGNSPYSVNQKKDLFYVLLSQPISTNPTLEINRDQTAFRKSDAQSKISY